MSKLFVLVVCVFMFQPSLHALQFYNNTEDSLYYVVQVRQKGMPGILCELDLSKDGIYPGATQKLKLKNWEVIEFLEAAEKLLEEEEKRRALKLLEGEKVSLKEEGIPSGVSQKLKLKKWPGKNFFKRGGKKRPIILPEEAVVPAQSSENASKSSSASLPGIAVKEEGVLEVAIRIEKCCKNSDGSEGARTVIYDENLCTLKTIDDLIHVDDFAWGEFCKDENNTYTLKLTGLRDTSNLVITEGEEIANESRG